MTFHRSEAAFLESEIKEVAVSPAGQLRGNPKWHMLQLWRLYKKHFVKEEVREPSPWWGQMCRNKEAFPVRNILSKPVLGFLLLKSMNECVAVCTKQPVVNSYRKIPESNRKSKGKVLEKYRIWVAVQLQKTVCSTLGSWTWRTM